MKWWTPVVAFLVFLQPVLAFMLLVVGASATEAPLSEEATVASLLTYTTTLSAASLHEANIRQVPGIPILLDTLKRSVHEFLPCTTPCALTQLTEIYNAAMYGNSTYGQCLVQTGTELVMNFTSLNVAFDILSNPTLICPMVSEVLNCAFDLVEAACGKGMKNILEELTTSVLEILDCGTTNSINPIECLARPLVTDPTVPYLPYGIGTQPVLDIIDCINQLDSFQNVGAYFSGRDSVQEYRDIYTAESAINFRTFCRLGNDARDCALQVITSYRNTSLDCSGFDRFVNENVNAILEFFNCYSNGTTVLRCLLDPGLYFKPSVSRRKRQLPTPSFDTCVENFIPQLSGNLSMDVSGSNITRIVASVARSTCGPIDRLWRCSLEVLTDPDRAAVCSFIEPGLYSMLSPTLFTNNKLGQCVTDMSMLSAQEKESINRCRCLETYPQNTMLGTCSAVPAVPADPAQMYVVKIVVRSPWMDSLANSTCAEGNFLTIICQEVQRNIARGPDINVDIQFLGVIPTSDDEVAVLFTVPLNTSVLGAVTEALRGAVGDRDIQNVRVSQDIDVRLLSDLEFDIRPTSGPEAGGTLVTVTGRIGLELLNQVFFGMIQCDVHIQSQVLSICTTAKITESDLVNRPLNVTLQRPGLVVPSGALFTYEPDPIILRVEPLETILNGGVLLTVFGAFLDVPTVRVMTTTVTARETGRNERYSTTCRGTLSDRMFCPTPPIMLASVLENQRKRRAITAKSSLKSDGTKSRRRRQTLLTINEEENIDVEIGFIMDGVEEYRNLSMTLPQFSRLDIYANPIIQDFPPPSFSMTFTPTWPVEEEFLQIKPMVELVHDLGVQIQNTDNTLQRGENLIGGIQEDDYTIMIGEAICGNTEVLSNLIVCEPPKKRPQVAPEDDAGDNRIPVKVLYADQVALPGHLNYIQTLWEYPPGRYGIIGALCGLALIIGVIILCVYCHSRKSSPGDKGRNLVRRVKRWSRRSPRRFSSFIPTGPRQHSNYTGTTTDVNLSPYRGHSSPYRENYPTHFNDPIYRNYSTHSNEPAPDYY